MKDSVRDISFYSSSVQAGFSNDNILLAATDSHFLYFKFSESIEIENLAKRPLVIPSCIPNLQHTIYPKTKTPLLEITTGQKRPPNFKNSHINLDFIDHLAIAVEENHSEKVCEWYQTNFKFQRLDDIKIQTSYNGMLLKVYNFYLRGILQARDRSECITPIEVVPIIHF